MGVTFRRAVREQVGLILGLIGPSGGGKTYSALRVATGLAGGKPFAVLDTEAGRAKMYADFFAFDHADLTAPFRPETYAEAIRAADEAGYPVIVVDSCSHEHAGEGGLLDWHEEELQRMAKDDPQKREACKMAAWIKPKMAHKAMVQRLLQVRAHLILCFRAEEKIGMVRGRDGRLEVVQLGWQPICEKGMPYELTASFMVLPERPGYPQPIKLQEQHKAFVDLNAVLDEKAGELLGKWAAGGKAQGGSRGNAVPVSPQGGVHHPAPSQAPPSPADFMPPSDMDIVVADYRRSFERADTVHRLTSEGNKMEMDADLTRPQREGLRLYLKECLNRLGKKKP
jgi:hypothetical protein